MSVPSVQSSRGHHQDTELTRGGETMGRFGAVWRREAVTVNTALLSKPHETLTHTE